MVDDWDHSLELEIVTEAIKKLCILWHLSGLILERVCLFAAFHEAGKNIPLQRALLASQQAHHLLNQLLGLTR